MQLRENRPWVPLLNATTFNFGHPRYDIQGGKLCGYTP